MYNKPTTNIRISQEAHTKLAEQCKFGETLAEVVDKLLGITTSNTSKGIKK
jgi:hypothetical protein